MPTSPAAGRGATVYYQTDSPDPSYTYVSLTTCAAWGGALAVLVAGTAPLPTLAA